jgi:hypothetical protein
MYNALIPIAGLDIFRIDSKWNGRDHELGDFIMHIPTQCLMESREDLGESTLLPALVQTMSFDMALFSACMLTLLATQKKRRATLVVEVKKSHLA